MRERPGNLLPSRHYTAVFAVSRALPGKLFLWTGRKRKRGRAAAVALPRSTRGFQALLSHLCV